MKYFVVNWLGCEYIDADTVELTQHGTVFYKDGKVVAIRASKNVTLEE